MIKSEKNWRPCIYVILIHLPFHIPYIGDTFKRYITERKGWRLNIFAQNGRIQLSNDFCERMLTNGLS